MEAIKLPFFSDVPFIEYKGKEYRRLRLLSSEYTHIEVFRNDSLCRGYFQKEENVFEFYTSLEDREQQYRFLRSSGVICERFDIPIFTFC